MKLTRFSTHAAQMVLLKGHWLFERRPRPEVCNVQVNLAVMMCEGNSLIFMSLMSSCRSCMTRPQATPLLERFERYPLASRLPLRNPASRTAICSAVDIGRRRRTEQRQHEAMPFNQCSLTNFTKSGRNTALLPVRLEGLSRYSPNGLGKGVSCFITRLCRHPRRQNLQRAR